MGVKENVAIVERYFEGWNAHDPERIVELVSDDMVFESDVTAGPVRGADGVRQFAEKYLAAFPDMRVRVDQQIASPNTVVTRWTATGTHRAHVLGVPATGRKVEVHGTDVTVIRDGRVVRSTSTWNAQSLLNQLAGDHPDDSPDPEPA